MCSQPSLLQIHFWGPYKSPTFLDHSSNSKRLWYTTLKLWPDPVPNIQRPHMLNDYMRTSTAANFDMPNSVYQHLETIAQGLICCIRLFHCPEKESTMGSFLNTGWGELSLQEHWAETVRMSALNSFWDLVIFLNISEHLGRRASIQSLLSTRNNVFQRENTEEAQI